MKEEFVSFEDLYRAYKDCRKHKRNKESSVKFESNLYENLMLLYEELNNGTYQIGPSIAFVVTKPKYREVFAADFRDRIVQHLLIRKLEPYLEEYFDDSAYACRKGKGTLYGIRDIRSKMCEVSQNFTKDAWILKIDIVSFFMSIDKTILKTNLIQFMQNKCGHWENLDRWIQLAVQIINNRPELNCIKKGDLSLWDKLPKSKSLFNTSINKGLPIGNITSQFLENLYMTPFDKWLKSKVQGESGRYADDTIVISVSLANILYILEESRNFLKQRLDLELHPDKIYLQPLKHGIVAYGTIITGKGVLLSGKRVIGNAWSAIRQEQLNRQGSVQRVCRTIQRVNSYFGYFKNTYSYNIRKKFTNIILRSKYRPFIYSHKNKYIRLKPELKKYILKINSYDNKKPYTSI